MVRPAWQQAEDVAQVRPRLDVAKSAARSRDCAFAPDDRRHFHLDSECAATPISAAYSFAVSPLSPQRSTRFAHVSLDVRSISASAMETYVTATSASGTRLVERVRPFCDANDHSMTPRTRTCR
jgi:hypothetical protein